MKAIKNKILRSQTLIQNLTKKVNLKLKTKSPYDMDLMSF